jgi:predicted DNA-binding transcriptional regulator YafY
LEQVLPSRLRHRVSALSQATATFPVEGPTIDPDALATIAGACRDSLRLGFTYTAKDDRVTARQVEPSAVVYSGYRWYLVAFDLDRDDWRTFRLDRIQDGVSVGQRGRPRAVPGGDPAVFVSRAISRAAEPDEQLVPGRMRITAPAAVIRNRVPHGLATVEPDGPAACIVTTKGMWSRNFLVWMALLDEPLAVLGPPELAEAAKVISRNLAVAGDG